MVKAFKSRPALRKSVGISQQHRSNKLPKLYFWRIWSRSDLDLWAFEPKNITSSLSKNKYRGNDMRNRETNDVETQSLWYDQTATRAQQWTTNNLIRQCLKRHEKSFVLGSRSSNTKSPRLANPEKLAMKTMCVVGWLSKV